MKKAAVISIGAALVTLGVALLWPRSEPPAPSEPDPVRPETVDFQPVEVRAPEGSGLTLRGSVFDSSGKPVAGAEVFLAASAQASLTTVHCGECGERLLSCEARETGLHVADLLAAGKGALTPAASTRTDGEGAFRFEQLSGVSFTVWARAEGLGEGVKERAAPGEAVELYLPPLRSIAGTLQDERGHPIEGGTVYALSRRLAVPHEARSGRDGVFEVQGLGEGPFYVVATAEGFLPAMAAQVEAGPQPLRLALPGSRRLEVTVKSGGAPVDATVRVTADHLSREERTAGGVARFDRLYPDQVMVTAFDREQSSAPHAVLLSEPVTRITLELEAGGRLLVTVVDAEGQPVPTPEVALTTRGGEVVSRRKARTGELVIFGPLGEGQYLVRGIAQGFKPEDLPVSIRPGETSVELVMERGTLITGRVLDEYGRPGPGISILVNPTGDSVVADAEGRFVALVPTPGLYQLHAHHSDWGGGQLQVTAPAADVVLQLEPRAGVQVQVQSEGRRLEGASAVLWVDNQGSFRSDRPSGADGLVTVRGMPPGSYWLVAGHPDFLPSERQRVTLEEGQLLRVTAELKPGARIAGEVVDTQGAPVAGASVAVLPRGAEPATTDGLGRFEVRPLRAGVTYRLEAKHPNYEQLERVQIAAGDERVRIVLKRRGIFRGRVLADSGAPLKRFRVDDHEVSSADGRFELPLSSTEDRVIVAVEAPGYEPLMVDRPATPDLGDLVLRRAPEFSGVVRDEAGSPIADAVITCDACEALVLSDADGRFSLAAPPYVTQYVVIARKGQLSGTRSVTRGGPSPIELVLRPTTHLTGVAYLGNGQPAAGVEIEGINVERSEPVTIVTGPQGRYAVDLPPGSYRFSVESLFELARGRAPLAVMFEVQGPSAQLDFGPAPGTASLAVGVRPTRGYALWVVRGELASVGNPPVDLLKARYGQLVYQPLEERVVIQGLPPGRYTVVWGAFHIETPGGPWVRNVDVPGVTEVVVGG